MDYWDYWLLCHAPLTGTISIKYLLLHYYLKHKEKNLIFNSIIFDTDVQLELEVVGSEHMQY